MKDVVRTQQISSLSIFPLKTHTHTHTEFAPSSLIPTLRLRINKCSQTVVSGPAACAFSWVLVEMKIAKLFLKPTK